MRVNSLKAGNTGVRNEIVSTCDELLSVGKDAARQIGKHALDVSKTAAIDAGKRLVDRAAAKMFPPKIYQNSKDMLASLINDDINNMLASGSGLSKAIAIQDLVRRLNGGGMKIA